MKDVIFGVVGLRSGRNTYGIWGLATGIVACGLFADALFRSYNSGIGEGWQPGKFTQLWAFVGPACCIVGAVGVILLDWYLLKLARGIMSIARLLKAGKPVHARRDHCALIKELSEAIRQYFDSCQQHTAELETQAKDLQVSIQLSQRQKRNTEAIIYSIRDVVLVVDEFDKLLMANEAAGDLFGFDFKNSTYGFISELIDPAKSELIEFLLQCRRTKARATKREIEFSEDTGPRTFDCIVSCVYDQAEQVCGAVAVLHDITREKEISQMKNDFVNHVSHELKTPLASITAYSEMLADGEADDEETRKEFYSVIQTQAERLNRLIEDILNTSRIESGLIKVNRELVSLTILIEEQLKMIKSYAQEKDIEVVGRKPIVFDQVYVDRDMISQVIINLLSNAVKYTQSGGSVKVESEVDETSRLARISVSDTGVGIPEEEIEHVFDKFYRVSANKKCAKGTGLGLNLVKQIIEKVHDGRVFVTSEVGVGSTFGFELPLATAETIQA